MGFADVWNKTLVYFGIAEEEDWDEDGYVTDEDLQRSYAERPNVRRLAPRRRDREFDDWTDPEPTSDHTAGESTLILAKAIQPWLRTSAASRLVLATQ